MKKMENFKYLISEVASDASVDQDIMKMTKVDWLE